MSMMSYMADDVYGPGVQAPPTSSPTPTQPAGAPAPSIRKTAPTGGVSTNNPTVLLVGLTALAILLIHFSVGFDFGIKIGAKR